MKTKKVIKFLKDSFPKEIAHEELISARKAQFKNLRILPFLRKKLKELGLKELYTHQAKAIKLIREGKNVIIVTGTASGKSLCYNIPVIESFHRNKKARALYVFPTKALAQDQLRVIESLRIPELLPATYDGDTPVNKRRWIRKNASIVLTNPEMIHCGILPHHEKWGDFFLNLKFVVVDEVHTLKGIFGANSACLFRRLRRVAEHYNSFPQFILASATIANPHEAAEKLIGLPFEVVDNDGSPQSERTFLFLNPSFIQKENKRKSSNVETTRLFIELIKRGIKTIVFSKSRQAAELILKYAQRELKKHPKLKSKITAYRAGYLPAERRKIEKRLFDGELLGVSSTPALEYGIDVGELEASIINGFPGTIASTWQQAGRAGRRETGSLSILVAQEDPLDQYYMSHPSKFFSQAHEAAVFDPENLYVLSKHLLCAAFEKPLKINDKKLFGSSFPQVLKSLTEEGKLVEKKGKWFWTKKSYPHDEASLRTATFNDYSIVEKETGVLIGTIDASTAFFFVHPGAIYLHQGNSYLVKELNLEAKVALVELTWADYYTQPREETFIEILTEERKKEVGKTQVYFGQLEVTNHVIAYQRRHIYTGKILSTEELSLPPQVFKTKGFWFIVPENLIRKLSLDERQLAGGIHALEHAGIGILPLFAICDRWDIGGVSTPLHYQTDETTIFIYDGIEGGIGIAEKGFELFNEHLKATWHLIKDCPCERGCPSCIQSPKCGNWNEPLDKEAALRVLEELIIAL